MFCEQIVIYSLKEIYAYGSNKLSFKILHTFGISIEKMLNLYMAVFLK